MIEFKCSQCGEDMEAPQSLSGQTEKCPKCGLLNRVPLSQPVPGEISLAPTIPDSTNSAAYERTGSGHQDPGFLYVLVNSAMPGLIKVGKTQRDPDSRAQELSGVTGVPTPFVVAYHEWFSDCSAAEDHVHAILEANGYRVADNREFFFAPVKAAIQAIMQAKARQPKGEAGELGTPDSSRSAVAGNGEANSEPWSDLMAQAEAAHYGLGDAVEDPEEAARLYEQAARLGCGAACLARGELCLCDEFGSDERTAIKWFNEAVQKGAVEGYAELALVYLGRQQAENAIKCFTKYSGRLDGQSVTDTFLDYIFRFLITAARNRIVIADLGGAEQFRDQIIEHRTSMISRFESRNKDVGFLKAELLRVRYMLYGSVPDQRRCGKITFWHPETQGGFITATATTSSGTFRTAKEELHVSQYQIVEGALPPYVGQPATFVPIHGDKRSEACVVCLSSPTVA